MTPEWNILEDILKSQKQIDAQIQPAEQELVVLDEKRKALQIIGSDQANYLNLYEKQHKTKRITLLADLF